MKDLNNKEEAEVVEILSKAPGFWDPPEHSKLKMSLGEVELILETKEPPVNNKEEAEQTPETETQVSEIQEASNSVVESNAIALSRQGWTNNEIAKVLHLSRDEVDLILKINPRD